MAISVVYNILLLVSLPALNLGLLSDYKICGDAECESPMSRVQAIRDYHGRDCRFLSFQKGDTIFVYHKLTGKREDLWAGTIDKQFGYFSKDAVQVEDVHTTTEKVVATQDSDFFCMDELGYIIDSHLLDGDDDVDEENPNQELKTVLHADGSITEGLAEATESPTPVHEAENTLTEEIQHAAKKDAEATEGSQEAPAAPDVQGGSGSAPWLGSSVTGWFGLNSAEDPDNLGEVEKKAEDQETADEVSLASSVTGWLGWGEGREAEENVESKDQDLNIANSFTSSMTGWLGFEAKTEQPVAKDQSEGEGDGEEEQEPAEKFRSRRMSLELEGSHSEEEDKGEMGTLEWLGAGLTKKLSFGRTAQETVAPASEETGGENAEEKQQASWFQVGIGNILGYEKEADLSAASDLRDKYIEDSQSEESPEDQKVPFKTETSEEVIANRNHGRDSVGDKDRASAEGEDSNTQSPVEENASSLSGISSVLTSLFPAGSEGKEEHNVLENARMELNLQKDVSLLEQHSEREEGGEIKPHTGETDQVDLTQSDVRLPSDLNYVDLNVKSTEQLTDEGDKMEKLDEMHHETDNISHEVSVVEGNEEKEEDFQGDSATTSQQADELAEESQVNDSVQETTEGVSEEQNSPAGQGGEPGVDHLGSVTVTETEANQEESVDEDKMLHVEESTQGFEESQSTAENTESQNVLEPDSGASHASESKTSPEDDAGQDSNFPLLSHRHGDADNSAKSGKMLPVQTEPEEQETSGIQRTLGFDNETNKMKEYRETEEVHALDQPQVLEEDKKEEDVNLSEEKKLKELKRGEAEGQQEHSEVTTEVAAEMNTAQSRDEVEEKEEDKIELKPEEEQGAVEDVSKEEKKEEINVVEEILQQTEGLKQEKEKTLVGLQEGDDTGIAKKKKELQEPLKELKDREDMGEKQLHTDNLNEGKGEELKGEEGSEESRDEGHTRVMTVEAEETEAVLESKEKDIQEEVTEATDVLNREEFSELKDEENQQGLKEEENQQQLKDEENHQDLKEEENKQVFKEEENHKEEENKQEFKEEENQQEFKEEENQLELKEEENKQEFKEEENQQEFKEEENKQEFKEEENKQEFNEEENKQEFKEEENKQEFNEEENKQEFNKEENKQESEEGDEAAVPGNVEVEKTDDGAQGGSQEEDILESASAQTDRTQSENQQRNTEEEAGNRNGDGVVQEKEEEVADTKEGTRQEEDLAQGLRCHGELCSPTGNEHTTIESAEQRPLTAEDQFLMVKTEESLGMDGGKDREPSEEQTNNVAETDEKTSAGAGNVESSNSMADPDAEVPGSAGNTDVTCFSDAPPEDNILHQEDKNHSDPSRTSAREKTEHTHHDDSAIDESESNDTVLDSAPNSKSMEATGSSGSFAQSQVVMQDHVGPQDPPASLAQPGGHGKDGPASQTGKAFGLFNSAFSFFRETESTSSLSDSDQSEGSKAEASQTLDREPQPDLPEVTGQSLISEPQTHESHEPATPSSSSVEPEVHQPATPSESQPQHSSASTSTGNPVQSKTFIKDYRTLLAHVGQAHLALLVELFGRHKLQFLDYILGVSEPAAEERDHDESILTDIETLLDYHMGALAGPSARPAGSPQDEQKAAALQKLQDLLAKVRQSFNRGNSGDTNHQDNAEPGCVGHPCLSEGKNEGITTDAESAPVGRGSAHSDVSSPIGILRHVRDFVHQITNDLTVHGHAVGEQLVWLTTQV